MRVDLAAFQIGVRPRFVPCPAVPGKITGRNPTVKERAPMQPNDSALDIDNVDARSLTVAFLPVCVPKVSHPSQKWDTLVGHFIVVFNNLNPCCPAVPLYIENNLFVPDRNARVRPLDG